MRAAAWWVVLGVSVAVTAAADPKPKEFDFKPYRDKAMVLADTEGGVYVVAFEPDTKVFYGTAKTLYDQVIEGGKSRNGDAWGVTTWAPRLEFPFMAEIRRSKDGDYAAVCQDKVTHKLTLLTGDKALAVLDKAAFLTTPYIRRAHMLARDDGGVYYYVDVLAKVYGGKGYRVFVGKKGAMKELPLTDVATDTAGDVFSTKTGDLRLVRIESDGATQKSTAVWIRGEKRKELVSLDTYMNAPVIHRDLGIYKITGVMCGDI
jgi:hypothetical protein